MPRTVYPILQYRDPRGAIDWLERAFGFVPAVVDESPDGGIGHAELRCGDGSRDALAAPGGRPRRPRRPGLVLVVVADPDAHHARPRRRRRVVRPLTDLDYGSRDYCARDLEGNLWSFGTYAPE